MIIEFVLNGNLFSIETSPDRRVIDLLKEDLSLTGVKEGCGSGECGACTIIVDGKAKLSCLMLAMQLQGRVVRTIEGMSDGDLHPIQRAFVECGSVQCGYCTPGMIMTSEAMCAAHKDLSEEDVREGLSGNLCRCTGYKKIVDAIIQHSRRSG